MQPPESFIVRVVESRVIAPNVCGLDDGDSGSARCPEGAGAKHGRSMTPAGARRLLVKKTRPAPPNPARPVKRLLTDGAALRVTAAEPQGLRPA